MKTPPALGEYVVLASADDAAFYLVVNVCGGYVDLIPYSTFGVKRRPKTHTCHISLVQYPQGKQRDRLKQLNKDLVTY